MPLLDKKQAAEYLTICTDTLMTEQSSGRLIGFKIGGRWRFDTRDLDRYIELKRQEAAEEADIKSRRKTKGRNVLPIKTPANGNNQPLVRHWVPGMKIEDVCNGVYSKKKE